MTGDDQAGKDLKTGKDLGRQPSLLVQQEQKLNSLRNKFIMSYSSGNYIDALQHVTRLVELEPNDHWVWTRLSSVCYELKNYADALQASELAMNLDSQCPLVLWDYAGVLGVLERGEEAIEIYKDLLMRGVESIAYDQCGEGMKWARSLLNDCRFKLAELLFENGGNQEASKYMNKHLSNRSRGQYSCFSKQRAESFLGNIENKMREILARGAEGSSDPEEINP